MKRRHALSDESTRAATVLGSLGSWASIPGAIPEPKILKVFREKNKSLQPTEVANVYADEEPKTTG